MHNEKCDKHSSANQSELSLNKRTETSGKQTDKQKYEQLRKQKSEDEYIQTGSGQFKIKKKKVLLHSRKKTISRDVH